MRHFVPLLLGAMLAAGCVRAQLHAEQPALRVAGADDLTVLRQALAATLGRDVTLADDVFVRDSTLFVEPVPPRAAGQRIEGRVTQPPERFTLLRVDGACRLLREATGERLALPGLRCRTP